MKRSFTDILSDFEFFNLNIIKLILYGKLRKTGKLIGTYLLLVVYIVEKSTPLHYKQTTLNFERF